MMRRGTDLYVLGAKVLKLEHAALVGEEEGGTKILVGERKRASNGVHSHGGNTTTNRTLWSQISIDWLSLR